MVLFEKVIFFGRIKKHSFVPVLHHFLYSQQLFARFSGTQLLYSGRKTTHKSSLARNIVAYKRQGQPDGGTTDFALWLRDVARIEQQTKGCWWPLPIKPSPERCRDCAPLVEPQRRVCFTCKQAQRVQRRLLWIGHAVIRPFVYTA